MEDWQTLRGCISTERPEMYISSNKLALCYGYGEQIRINQCGSISSDCPKMYILSYMFPRFVQL